MKLMSYTGTKPGIPGIGNWAVRVRLYPTRYSHTEVMFEPGDGCEQYMPDGSLEPDENGAYWFASASARDVMPDWGNGRNYRAGRFGGVRFKRIVPEVSHWDQQDYPFDPLNVAQWFKVREGSAYDWRLIFSFFGIFGNLIFGSSSEHYHCTEACASAAGFKNGQVFDPRNFPPVIDRINRLLTDYVKNPPQATAVATEAPVDTPTPAEPPIATDSPTPALTDAPVVAVTESPVEAPAQTNAPAATDPQVVV